MNRYTLDYIAIAVGGLLGITIGAVLILTGVSGEMLSFVLDQAGECR